MTERISASAGARIDAFQIADRRDRLWLITPFAVVLPTLLGSAGEQLGYDRHLKTNTTRRPTHSLFRQGSIVTKSCETSPIFSCSHHQAVRRDARSPASAHMFGAI